MSKTEIVAAIREWCRQEALTMKLGQVRCVDTHNQHNAIDMMLGSCDDCGARL